MVTEEFQNLIYSLVRAIPRGRVATYGQLALLAGYPERSRMVGRALRDVPRNLKVPCHRDGRNRRFCSAGNMSFSVRTGMWILTNASGIVLKNDFFHFLSICKQDVPVLNYRVIFYFEIAERKVKWITEVISSSIPTRTGATANMAERFFRRNSSPCSKRLRRLITQSAIPRSSSTNSAASGRNFRGVRLLFIIATGFHAS